MLGYVGSRSVALAIERNEVQGACGFSWPSISATNVGWFGPEGFMRVLVQTHVKGHPQLNAEKVPLVMDFARTPEERAILELYFSHSTFGRPYVMAPEVPADSPRGIAHRLHGDDEGSGFRGRGAGSSASTPKPSMARRCRSWWRHSMRRRPH